MEAEDTSNCSEDCEGDEEASDRGTSETNAGVLLTTHILKRGCTVIRQSWFTVEAMELLGLAFPLCLTVFFQQLLPFISLVFVGHITKKSLEFDAAALGSTFVNITGPAIGQGMGSAAITLCTQTYGFKDYKRVGIILQRGILMLGLTLFPVFALWLNSETLLLLLQQSPCVARLGAQYIRISCFGLPSDFLLVLLGGYLQSQGIVWIFVWAGLLANIVSAGLHGILLFPANLGVVGAAIAVVLANTSFLLIVLVYMCARGLHKQTWGGWSWESLSEWRQYLKLGIPGLLMVCIEWWSYEVATFVTGSIDDTQLAINGILLSLSYIAYMIPLGVGMATSIRVGNELGAGNPLRAKRAAYTALGLILVSAVITSASVGATRMHIGKLFSSEEVVIEGVAEALYVIAPMMFFDQIQGVLLGIIQGSGRQTLGAVVNFICFYIIGLPLGISLALAVHMGTLGMWIGFATAETVQCVILGTVVVITDWNYQSQRTSPAIMVQRCTKVYDRSYCSSSWYLAIKQAQDSRKKASTGTYRSDAEPEKEEEMGSDHDSDSMNMVESDADEISDQIYLQGATQHPDSDEAIPLVSFSEDASEQSTTAVEIEERLHVSQKSKLKVLLYKSTFFIVGVMLLICGGIASQYQPGADYSNCVLTNATTSVVYTSLRVPLPTPFM